MAKSLTQKQELFCQYYIVKRGNATQAYIDAYKIDVTKKGSYAAARVSAHVNLTKDNIKARIRELLDEVELTDEFVDTELKHLIWQDENLGAKAVGVREYNKLKGRITEKKTVEHKGVTIQIGSDPDPDYMKKAQEKRKS
jgi:phage terminase small subunit